MTVILSVDMEICVQLAFLSLASHCELIPFLPSPFHPGTDSRLLLTAAGSSLGGLLHEHVCMWEDKSPKGHLLAAASLQPLKLNGYDSHQRHSGSELF